MMDIQERWLQEWPDRDLVVAYKGGVPEAYDEMYRRYNARIYSVCRRLLGNNEDAREATQETFLKAYQALPRFNGQYKLGAWLSRIATNVCVDHIRKRARSATLTPLNETHESTEVTLGPEDVVVRDEPALSTLDDIQPLHARALELRNLEGMSHVEIAEQLHMSPLQVKALLHRARVSFKRAWDNASGWALAPLATFRSWLHHGSKDATNVGAQLPAWTQAAGPLIVDRVAASAMVVVVALSGAGAVTRPTPPTVDVPVAAAPFSGVEQGDVASSSQDSPTAVVTESPALVAEINGLVEVVKETADEQAPKKDEPRPDEKKNDDSVPGSADKASQKLAKEVNERVQDVQDGLPDL
jgi:RNA polymerase sigma-70 factor, ECF subfamily